MFTVNKKIKIIIIGFGSIGQRHYKNLLKLGFKNIYIYDTDRGRLSGKGLKTVTDIKTATLRRFDVAFICNPSNLHIKTAIQCAKAGCHLFIEKPLSHNFNNIGVLQGLCQKNKLVVMVACNHRFHQGFRKLKTLLQKGIYGQPLLCRVACGYYLPTARKNTNFKHIYAAKPQGGGVVLDSGAHVVDYLRSLFGEIKKGIVLKSPLHTLGIKSEEAAYLALEHARGTISGADLDYVSKKPAHRIEIVTAQGLLTLDFKQDLLIFEDEKRKKKLYQGDRDVNKMFITEAKHFLRCVDKQELPLQGLGDGKRVLEVLLTGKL